MAVEHDFQTAILDDTDAMAGLSRGLDEAAKNGWQVVGIAATGGRVVALLRTGTP